MICRFCNHNLSHEFIDLINSPASNSFLTKGQLNEPEIFYPLKVYVCHNCFLVQVDEYQKSDTIFNSEYAYFSSYSVSWLKHVEEYVNSMVDRFKIDEKSKVIEIASNDGYLLQYFQERNIPVLGIEPTKNTADVALTKGIETSINFFGTNFAQTLVNNEIKADLLLGNNVLAHVPDINDFVSGMKLVLKKNGVITMEFPHLMQLVDNNQFDTIYHEHFSYLSFYTVKQIFESHRLEMFDVEELPTHGGSLRIYAKHKEDDTKEISVNVAELINKEIRKGINDLKYYKGFQKRAENIKLDLWSFLIEQKRKGKKVAAYGAAAKGNTLLNYCGIKNDMISFIVDANPHKQDKFTPACHIPVVSQERLQLEKPDFILILPWNLKDEVIAQLSYVKNWGAQFVVAIPEVLIFN
jgi:hypothetical protein